MASKVQWFFIGKDTEGNKSVSKKRFYTKETIRGIRISWLAEIPPLFYDWLLSFNKETR